MDNKDLITRFAEDCFRFETLHQEIDSLIADEVSEVLIYEYEDLANQAAEIVLKLSANGNNLGLNFYRYYVERLEYIIDYFRALLDYEETPLAEDEPNELDDEPAAEVHFEGFPAGCVFPPPPPFVYKKWELQFPPMTKDEANAATDEPDAVEEDDSEDEPSDEVDNENDAQAAESDEAADDTAAGAPLPAGEKPCTSSTFLGLNRLSSADRDRVRETFAMWHEMNEVTGRNRDDGQTLPAAENLEYNEWIFSELRFDLEHGDEHSILVGERAVRAAIEKTIDEIPGFRDSEEFKKLIEEHPTYKERLQ